MGVQVWTWESRRLTSIPVNCWFILARFTHAATSLTRAPVKRQGYTVGKDGQQCQRLKHLPVHQHNEPGADPAVLGKNVQRRVTQGWSIILDKGTNENRKHQVSNACGLAKTVPQDQVAQEMCACMPPNAHRRQAASSSP